MRARARRERLAIEKGGVGGAATMRLASLVCQQDRRSERLHSEKLLNYLDLRWRRNLCQKPEVLSARRRSEWEEIICLPMPGREIVVGVSGGSGASLARRFVELALAGNSVSKLHLVFSEASLEVARSEIDAKIATGEDWVARLEVPRAASRRIVLHSNGDVGASIASGSYPVAGMIVIPCSAGTLGAIANGISRDLLQRAADVCLKEGRPLVLAFRESPYSLVHIENMRKATLSGATVAPPSPAFYVDAPSMDRFLDAYCVRAARLLGLKLPEKAYRWEGAAAKARRARRS